MRWELLPGKSSSCLVMRPWTDSEKTPWAGRRPRSLSFSNQRCYATLKGAEGDLESLDEARVVHKQPAPFCVIRALDSPACPCPRQTISIIVHSVFVAWEQASAETFQSQMCFRHGSIQPLKIHTR